MVRRTTFARGLGIASLVLLVSGLGVAAASPADAAGGDDWGPHGALTSDSPVTVRWDNKGNNPDDVVPRDETQQLLHTDHKNYTDIAESLRTGYADYFGADNGLGGLEVTVSQTQDLVNQAVTVSFSGAKDGEAGGSRATGTFFSVMQCWGAMGADGKPAADAQPDSATCQSGLGGTDGEPDLRLISGDPLLSGGDWQDQSYAPFTAVDGTKVTDILNTPLFSRLTTNEFSGFKANAEGKGSRPFEIQTGSEAPGLGCGFRADAPSVSNCWLVVIPLNRPLLVAQGHSISPANSGMSPSLWAQRLQIKLGMQDVAASCPNGRAQSLSAGSELLPGAMQSWIPGICAEKDISLGYTSLGDEQVRQQYSTGAQDFILTSSPVDDASDTVYSPVAVAGVVVSFTVDNVGTGGQVLDLKLNARLVAKLLTQSYFSGVDPIVNGQTDKAPWVRQLVANVWQDPEFQALNPDLPSFDLPQAYQLAVGDLVVSTTRSDAVAMVWSWLLADPGAKSFLDGCPDPYGHVINPFYSTRSYTECQGDATQLETDAKSKRDATPTPENYEDRPMSYPSEGSVFPQVDWYERDAVLNSQGAVTILPLTFPDLHARESALVNTGRDAFRATYPSNTLWCDPAITGDQSCAAGPGIPGKWKSSAVPQSIGARTLLAITDTATAARYELPTAQLCDDDGKNCVGASKDSLLKAAADFVPSDTGVATVPTTPDYAGGAYPLTLPVYAAIKTTNLDSATAKAYGSVLDYISTAGQVPGFGSGHLSPGYAPLPADLVRQAADAVATLNHVGDPEATPPPKAPVVPPANHASAPTAPTTRKVPDPVPPADTVDPPSAPATNNAESVQAGAKTPVTEIGFPQFGLLAGLAGALIAGFVAPVVGRKRKLTR